MYFRKTFTFKTRRKGEAMLTSLFFLSIVSVSWSAPVSCPINCECFVDSLFNLKSASCERLFWNGTYFPNILQVQMRPASTDEPCRIFNNTSKMFPNLSRLDLSNCSLRTVPSVGSNDFKSVQTFDLSYNLIRDIPSSAFLRYPKLQFVNLANNPLNPQSPPAIESNSIYELNFDSCGIEKIPPNMFTGLPSLKWLTMSNNSLSTLDENSLPEGLRTIDLSKNKIINVPTDELIRLRNLRKVNLNANPINCTCGLMGFQNWVSGKGVIFVNVITCAYPHKYAGRRLNAIPQYEVCDAKVFEESSSSEQCAPNQICSNGISTDEGYVGDQPKDENTAALEQDEVIPINKNDLVVEDLEHMQLDGSGDGDGTDTPNEPKKIVTTTTEALSTEPPSNTTTTIATIDLPVTQNSPDGVVKMNNELGSALENNENPTTGSETSSELPKQATKDNETVQSSSEIETVTPSVNGQERLQNESGHKDMWGYAIPGIAVILIGVVCLTVYCSQCASKVDSYKPADDNIEGAELQEVSLLSEKKHATIIPNTKYPNERNEQVERLMNDDDRLDQNNVTEVNGNESQHSDDTIDCCKLSNGQSTVQNTLENVECTVAKVTTLPDSVPKTAIIRNI